MTEFKTGGYIDPRPAEYRKKLNLLMPRDLEGIGRWGLHMSEEEYNFLVAANPDTLGIVGDSKLHDKYWKEFLCSRASIPYRVREHI